MRLKPILFDTEMVRALLEGRKTVTRRVVKPQPVLDGHLWKLGGAAWRDSVLSVPVMLGHSLYNRAPYQPSDMLWVRETWQVQRGGGYMYRADTIWPLCTSITPDWRCVPDIPWKPSIHMPREAARIFLRVTDVRCERLQEITSDQIDAEGCKGDLSWFQLVWDSTVKPIDFDRYGWEANPWVWVIEFERVEKPAKNNLDDENP